MNGRRRTIHERTRRRGFTLIESLMAAGVLLIIVTAVALAITSGQQHGYVAQQRIAATLAADELMGRTELTPYADLSDEWYRHVELPGEMVDAWGVPLPSGFTGIGRSVVVVDDVRLRPVGSLEITGRTVIVRAFDEGDRTLVELRRFVPRPITMVSAD